MGLNIKNERVHALAREAARVTGQSQTSAIGEALEMLLAQYDAHPDRTDRERRLDILRGVALAWDPAAPGADHPTEVADLYDEHTGLPT